MSEKPCLVACSVLKEELKRLIENGELNADLVLVSKYFHDDYGALEKNLRQVLKHTLPRYNGNVVLVYGDLCLGTKGQMKSLVEEYDVVKIDALNCVDCQLGGKGKYLEEDPNQEIFFLSPGMMDSFEYVKNLMVREGLAEETFKDLFKGLKGFVILDTLGNSSKIVNAFKRFDIDLEILGTKHVGCKGVKNVIQEAIQKQE